MIIFRRPIVLLGLGAASLVAGVNALRENPRQATPPPNKIAFAMPSNGTAVASYQFYDSYYACVIKDEDWARNPRWEKKSPEPPISPGEALRIAEKHAPHLVPDRVGLYPQEIVGFNPQEILLKSLGGAWFYIVQLQPYPRSRVKLAPIKIVILMNGEVREPIKLPSEPIQLPSVEE